TDAGMAPYAVAFYRYGLSALVLFPLILRLLREQKKTAVWGILSGVSVGLGWIGFVSALKSVPVSTVGVLYMTYPVFTLLIGWIWFRDVPAKKGITGALMVITAALIASSPAAVEPRHLPAMLISLSAPITFGFAINVLIHKLTSIRPIARVATFTVGASISLLPLIALSAPATVLPQNASDWQLIAGLALGTALLPQLLYTTFAPRIGAARSAVAGSVELPTMFLIGWYTLGEVIGVGQWVACLLITLAILMTPARVTPNHSSALVPQRKPV
ncbi:MAG: DMT family transporter, partial [Gammaproteobacteria bacterium]|nr:DMT family transporter [Gammaproteobacteria bacterium]